MPDPNNVALRKYGAVFMLLPKCANTSIKRALLAALDRPDVEDVHRMGVFDYVSKEEARNFPVRVAFVRDPLARLASCYRDKFEELTDGRFLRGFERFGLEPHMGFDAFVDVVARLPDAKCRGAGDHFRSQSWSLCQGDHVIPNLVGRVETLSRDWDRVRSAMIGRGLNLPPLSHERRTDSSAVAWSPAARALALERYADDRRIWGYA